MSDRVTAKVFMHGRSQAVRLPKAFRLPGSEVSVRRMGHGVLLEPLEQSDDHFDAVFAAIDAMTDEPFIAEGRQQPPMPDDDISFDE